MEQGNYNSIDISFRHLIYGGSNIDSLSVFCSPVQLIVIYPAVPNRVAANDGAGHKILQPNAFRPARRAHISGLVDCLSRVTVVIFRSIPTHLIPIQMRISRRHTNVSPSGKPQHLVAKNQPYLPTVLY